MKKYFQNIINKLPVVLLLAAIVLTNSCSKDSDGSNFSTAGNPVFSAISIDSGANGAVVYVTGSGLGDLRSIIFSSQNVPALITPTLNTETSVVFRVPDTAYGGKQNIVLTNSLGKSITVPFKVLAFATVSSVSPSTDFMPGSVLTLSGVNLSDVTSVKLTGTSDVCTIVSKTKKQLVISMPATTKPRSTLDITNATGISTTTQEFVSVANARVVYDDALQNGFQSWSWGVDNINFSYGTEKMCGSYAMNAGWTGSWGGLQFGGGSIDLTGMNYLTFYVKGSAADQKYQVWLDWGPTTVITVPKNVWTYYKFKLSDFAPGKTSVGTFIVQIQGDAVAGNLWDDIMFIK
ncbi:MAG: hypothetical protein QM725_09340 [Lacibacter sp.]